MIYRWIKIEPIHYINPLRTYCTAEWYPFEHLFLILNYIWKIKKKINTFSVAGGDRKVRNGNSFAWFVVIFNLKTEYTIRGMCFDIDILYSDRSDKCIDFTMWVFSDYLHLFWKSKIVKFLGFSTSIYLLVGNCI